MANARARQLRKTMTPQEVKLWVHLRMWRERGYHFRRQSPLDGYILDFLCLKQKLVIEVDGGQHGESDQFNRDRARDAHLSRRGLRVLRFWNCDVDENLDGVLETIDAALASPTGKDPHPTGLAAGHPPLKKGRDKREGPERAAVIGMISAIVGHAVYLSRLVQGLGGHRCAVTQGGVTGPKTPVFIIR